MFDLSHAEYLAKNRLEKRLLRCALWILKQVPSNGILTIEQLSRKKGFSKKLIKEVIEAMQNTVPSVMQLQNDKMIFDYLEKNIEYVKHLLNAMSNAQGFFDPEGFLGKEEYEEYLKDLEDKKKGEKNPEKYHGGKGRGGKQKD